MALRYAVANGNWSALATWDGGASLPGAGDDVYANGKTVTIDQNVTVLSLRTTAGAPAVAGGGFTVATSGRTITADIYAGSSTCVTISASSATCTINGAIYGSSTTNSTIYGVNITGTTVALTVNGNVNGGTFASATNAHGIYSNVNATTLTLNGNATAFIGRAVSLDSTNAALVMTGNIVASSGNHGVYVGGAGSTSSITGGLNAGLTSGVAHALIMAGASCGNCTVSGGAMGLNPISYSGSGTCTLTPTNTSSCGPGFAFGGSGTLTLTGSIYAGVGVHGLSHSGNGTVNIIGSLYGSTTSTNASGAAATGSTGVLNVTGNVTGGTVSGGTGIWVNGSTCVVNVTGDVFGGSGAYTGSGGGNGIYVYAGSLNVYGTAIGTNFSGAANWNAGVFFGAGSGTVFVQVAKGNDYPNGGLTGAAPGVAVGATSMAVTVDAVDSGSGGVLGFAAIRVYLRDAGANFAKMRQSNLGAVTVMGEVANDYPAQANVRLGVSYDFGAKTGTCAVPPAGSVALGVPVDATTGTAVLGGGGSGLTAADVWAYATRSLTDKAGFAPAAADNASAVRAELATELSRIDQPVSAAKTLTTAYDAAKTASQFDPATDTVAHVTLVDTATTLTNSPDVPTPAEIAGQVRTELATELARIDQPVSAAKTLTAAYDAAKSAATSAELGAAVSYILANLPAGITPADVWTHATRSLTQDVGLSPSLTARLENCATVQTVGDQLAALGA